MKPERLETGAFLLPHEKENKCQNEWFDILCYPFPKYVLNPPPHACFSLHNDWFDILVLPSPYYVITPCLPASLSTK